MKRGGRCARSAGATRRPQCRRAKKMSWWRRWLPNKPAERQLDSELRHHIDELTREHIAAGVAPEEARRRALIEFGGPEQIKEELREVHSLAILDVAQRNFK